MKFKKSNSLNLYLILFLVALFLVLVLLLDTGIGMLQKKLERNQENFVSSPSVTLNNSGNNNNNSVESSPSYETESNENKSNQKKNLSPSNSEESKDFEDDSFLHEIENKDLDLDDFYPSQKVRKSRSAKEMWKYTQELDLFQQIIPKLKTGYLGIVTFDSRIAGIYQTEDLSSKKWERLEKDIPEKMVHPIFISYDQDRM